MRDREAADPVVECPDGLHSHFLWPRRRHTGDPCRLTGAIRGHREGGPRTRVLRAVQPNPSGVPGTTDGEDRHRPEPHGRQQATRKSPEAIALATGVTD